MTSPHDRHPDIRRRLGLRPIINVSGTMTALGASIVVPDAVRAVTEILPEFVEIGDLQRKASAVIARLTGARPASSPPARPPASRSAWPAA